MSTAQPEAAQRANAEGIAALRSGNGAAALRAFTEAVAADPKAGPLWRNLAHACRLNGDVAGERAALDRALAIDQTDFAANLRLAQLLERTGDELGAMRAWSGALQLAAGLPAPSEALRAELAAGQAYVAALQDRIEHAGRDAIARAAGDLDETGARRVGAFIDVALGRRRVFANQCAGVHFPFLPADEFFDLRHFPWFATLEAGAGAIREELHALLASGESALRPYVRLDAGTPANIWDRLDGSLDWSACFLWEYGVPNQPVLDACPRTAAILSQLPLQRIPGRAPNAFFSIIRPGREIPPHTGVTNTRAIVHLALDIPEGCGFRVGGETRAWIEGKAFAFDDTIEHEAWNTSDKPRAILILDCWNPHLSEGERAAITAWFAASDAAMESSKPLLAGPTI